MASEKDRTLITRMTRINTDSTRHSELVSESQFATNREKDRTQITRIKRINADQTRQGVPMHTGSESRILSERPMPSNARFPYFPNFRFSQISVSRFPLFPFSPFSFSALPLFLILVFSFFPLTEIEAQCSMCRAVIGSNIEGGETVRGLGLNNAILYIMGIPYLCLAVLGWVFWGHKLKGKKNP